jgi:hypothetical protein
VARSPETSLKHSYPNAHVDVVPEVLSFTQHNWTNGEVQFVDQSGLKVLPDSCYPASNARVASIRCLSRLFERGVNSFGNATPHARSKEATHQFVTVNA